MAHRGGPACSFSPRRHNLKVRGGVSTLLRSCPPKTPFPEPKWPAAPGPRVTTVPGQGRVRPITCCHHRTWRPFARMPSGAKVGPATGTCAGSQTCWAQAAAQGAPRLAGYRGLGGLPDLLGSCRSSGGSQTCRAQAAARGTQGAPKPAGHQPLT